MSELGFFKIFMIYLMETLGISLGIFFVLFLIIVLLILLNMWSEKRKWGR